MSVTVTTYAGDTEQHERGAYAVYHPDGALTVHADANADDLGSPANLVAVYAPGAWRSVTLEHDDEPANAEAPERPDLALLDGGHLPGELVRILRPVPAEVAPDPTDEQVDEARTLLGIVEPPRPPRLGSGAVVEVVGPDRLFIVQGLDTAGDRATLHLLADDANEPEGVPDPTPERQRPGIIAAAAERAARDYFGADYAPAGTAFPDTPDGARLHGALVAWRAAFARGVEWANSDDGPREAQVDALRAEVARLSTLLDDAAREADRADHLAEDAAVQFERADRAEHERDEVRRTLNSRTRQLDRSRARVDELNWQLDEANRHTAEAREAADEARRDRDEARAKAEQAHRLLVVRTGTTADGTLAEEADDALSAELRETGRILGEVTEQRDAARAEVKALAKELATMREARDAHRAALAEADTWRREVEEQTARAEAEHAARLTLVDNAAATARELDRLRAERDEARQRVEELTEALRVAFDERDRARAALDEQNRAWAQADEKRARPLAGQATRDQTGEPLRPPLDADSRRPRLDAWPSDAVTLTYREVRCLIGLHLDTVAERTTDNACARQAQALAQAMRDGETPLRVSEVVDK